MRFLHCRRLVNITVSPGESIFKSPSLLISRYLIKSCLLQLTTFFSQGGLHWAIVIPQNGKQHRKLLHKLRGLSLFRITNCLSWVCWNFSCFHACILGLFVHPSCYGDVLAFPHGCKVMSWASIACIIENSKQSIYENLTHLDCRVE